MEYCKITPIESKKDAKIGDCVFCRLMNGSFMVHRITDKVKREFEGTWYKIGNTWDETYGWTKEVFGIAESTDIFEKYYPKYYN